MKFAAFAAKLDPGFGARAVSPYLINLVFIQGSSRNI